MPSVQTHESYCQVPNPMLSTTLKIPSKLTKLSSHKLNYRTEKKKVGDTKNSKESWLHFSLSFSSFLIIIFLPFFLHLITNFIFLS